MNRLLDFIKQNNPKEMERELYAELEKRKPKHIPIDKNGKITNFQNNTVDALRHSYASGSYAQQSNKTISKIFGNMNELFRFRNPQNSKNMDLWNNAVGRKYGALTNNRTELLDKLLEALKNGELITNTSDPRIYVDDNSILEILPRGEIFVIEENATGENLTFYDPRSGIVMDKIEFVIAIKRGEYPMYEIRIINNKETPVAKKDKSISNNLD